MKLSHFCSSAIVMAVKITMPVAFGHNYEVG
jgi:hypothetical protein